MSTIKTIWVLKPGSLTVWVPQRISVDPVDGNIIHLGEKKY